MITEILKQIWELPWYKVLVIAMADDCIFFLKTWWFYVGIILIYMMFVFWYKGGRRR